MLTSNLEKEKIAQNYREMMQMSFSGSVTILAIDKLIPVSSGAPVTMCAIEK